MKKYIFLFLSILAFLGCEQEGAIKSINGDAAGQGGSTARFTILGDYLYMIESDRIIWFDISENQSPVQAGEVQTREGQETIFPFGGTLYVGRNDGVSFYSIGPNGHPVFEAEVFHIIACDPVVANEKYAFATLRVNNCSAVSESGEPTSVVQSENLLMVYDAVDISNPSPVTSLTLEDPFGLALAGDYLFVCDGFAGLKVFDVSDPTDSNKFKMVAEIRGQNTIDAIVLEDVLIVVGPQKLIQYDYSDPKNLVELSTINVD